MKLREIINQFLLDCETRGLTPSSVALYRRELVFFSQKLEQEHGVVELEQVRIIHLRQFVQLLLGTKADANNPRKPTQDKPLSAFTIRGYVRVIRQFFRWCVDEEWLDTNPASRLAHPKPPAYLIATFTPEHIEKMLAACDVKAQDGFRNYVLLLVLLDTGMRVSELCNLQIADVLPRYVKVFGKGRKEREIGIHPEVGKVLWKYIHKHRKPIDPDETRVFIGCRGTPLSPDGVHAVLDRIKRKCGLEGVRVSPHTFRHTFAKMYLRRGGEIFKLSREMGHSGVQVTETYLKDFMSVDARQGHTEFSPIEEINLQKKKRGRGKAL